MSAGVWSRRGALAAMAAAAAREAFAQPAAEPSLVVPAPPPVVPDRNVVLETAFDHYEPVRGPAPERPRTDDNPLSREEYLRRVVRRGP